MDKQELYVATSRSRGETWLYATPEIQSHREEFAPRSPHLREGLQHIAEAAERDGAQAAAHDVALRAELDGLSPRELHERAGRLRSAAWAEEIAEERSTLQARSIAGAVEQRERLAERREAVKDSAERESKLAFIESSQRALIEHQALLEAEAAQLPAVSHEARARLAATEHRLAELERQAVAAARVSPPTYVLAELGERPADPADRQAWDAAVGKIAAYRQKNGIVDKERALGGAPQDAQARRSWNSAQRSIEQSRQRLGLEEAKVLARSRAVGLEM
jgi:hypothetical protein